MRHRLRPGAGRVAALAVLAVLAAGCSSAARGPGSAPVASLSGTGQATSAPQPLTRQQGDQNIVSFARCMRGHGVQVSDPVHRPGHAGLSIDLPSRGPATNAAYAACIHFIQANIDAKQAAAAASAAPHLAALTRYAQCMRSHGINMLDPTPLGELNLGHVPGITSDFGRYSPQFRAADAACRHFLPAGVRDDGTGP
ncbi:MAG TPA: hypothetical protein VMK84_16105 [Streptosporangiaceae bacterium]|nr:hypothetical protein [Streptosporangiaceae bacterium]